MPDCSELKNALIHVLSGLTYMSNDVIRKSGTYLDEVELLDSNSVEPITRNVKTLLQRININLTQFGVTFDTAVENYKKEQEIEKVKTVVSPKPHAQTLNVTSDADAVFPKTTNNKNEVYFQQPSKPGPSNSGVGSFEEAVIKEESRIDGDYTECDDSRLDLKTELNESSGKEGDINDELEAEMKLDENDEGKEIGLTDSEDDVEGSELAEVWKDVGSEQIILPSKSKERYEAIYKSFKTWIDEKNVPICEKTLLTYFLVRSAKLKSPLSLWPEYSMLRATISINHSIDISKYEKLIAFLKKKNLGYHPKKSKVFTMEEMNKFLKEAPDDTYLMMKVVMIMGIMGACRRKDLTYMTRDSIKDCGTVIFVTLPSPKTNVPRTVTITNHLNKDVDFLEIFRKYVSLLPEGPSCQRFFYNFRNGKCIRQVVGVNTMGKIPAKVAKYLGLPDPNSYTGLAFRKTSASLLANPRMDFFTT